MFVAICLLAAHSLAFMITPLPSARAPARARLFASDDGAIDVEAVQECMGMKVGEIKAELDLRKISYEGLFEKEELAKLLAGSRRAGRADPSLVDRFNQQSAEQAWQATPETTSQAAADVDLNEATAADGTLPGGMSPDMLQAATQSPEIMALLRNPKLQQVMRTMMADGPEAASELLAADAEARELLSKFQALQASLGQ